jgi:hypothetical protein
VAPSIDGAGRRFIIMLAAEGLSREEAGGGGAAIAEEMEALIYQAFESGWGADATIEAAKAPVDRLAVDGAPAQPRWWTIGSFDHAAATSVSGPAGFFAQMLGSDQMGAP